VIAETTSNRSGVFDFKNLSDGKYWLVTTFENKEYKVPVRVQHSKIKQKLCSELIYSIEDSGEFTLRRVVTD